ncbi:TPA: M24 family metallopeptidase [Pseudomonas aeruginosa]|uniref:Creatinase n=1 Tax=Stutzerimonas stutzeri (strain ATCC 17588 / DSM 5190 / CCUG 11256 / JCM 5965 / LMG 11199 / NBRC 14165 / NCIMB 11358 / Stanier 221) TaxID=96563 RepID=F8H470_STUS2|nr:MULTISPECIES: M24 family metallopeptidase [Pseudomonadaceae]AEJ03398.1 creatinase [Stutzerimonas stutzeri]EKJ7123361.1 M24 family metallopeptidase [Pseudomonas aeruginosa]EKX3889766.1 M24 family metallopeptidase [Pseudomonas aeruginosa]EKX3950553.1 M24 family metallopeptidase [Pseudomonas aeruginosa]KSB93165.1 creatininase [Pseudomonas aeruginosa]
MSMPSLINLPNGPKMRATFSVAEMNRRLAMLRVQMQALQLDTVVLTSIHNVNYFGDFLYCSFGRSYALVVTQDRSTLITTNIDGGQGYRRSLGDNLIYTDWQRDNYFRAVREAVPQGARRVGLEFDHVSLDHRRKFDVALEGIEFLDVAPATMRMRMVKSAEEIELIKIGAAVADIGGAACVEAIAEGVPEYEVALAATTAMTREIARRVPHGELRDTWTWFQSGLNTDGAHNPVTTRRVQRGDILSLNCFPMIAGYYTALERTLFFGEPSERHLQLWEINCQVHKRGLELIRPGVRCCDIAAELNEIYQQHDLLQYRTFGYGHSFGVLSHYYGREAGLELREDIETVLEPGMVVSMEPMIMLPEGQAGAGGYREHDILVVQAHGAENITGFPFGPQHNILGA